MLRHDGSGHALHVGEQDVALTQRGDGHALLHTGRERLHPADPAAGPEHLGAAQSKDGVCVLRELYRLRHAVGDHEFHARRHFAQRLDEIGPVQGHKNDARPLPARMLAHRRRRFLEAEMGDERSRVGSGCDSVGPRNPGPAAGTDGRRDAPGGDEQRNEAGLGRHATLRRQAMERP